MLESKSIYTSFYKIYQMSDEFIDGGKAIELHQDLSHVFTNHRIEIIKTIQQKNPKSIGELAKILKRDIAAVYRDLKILEKFDIVLLDKQGKSVQPILKNANMLINFNVAEAESEDSAEQAPEEGDDSEADYIG